jgi:hypothetical protein
VDRQRTNLGQSVDREKTNLGQIVDREGTNLDLQESLSFKSSCSPAKSCLTRNNAAICHLLSAIGNWLFAPRSRDDSPTGQDFATRRSLLPLPQVQGREEEERTGRLNSRIFETGCLVEARMSRLFPGAARDQRAFTLPQGLNSRKKSC